MKMKIVLLCVSLFVLGKNTSVDAWEPVGFPYASWGEISYGEVEHWKIDTYIEQGIDWYQFTPHLTLNTFLGFRATLSDQPQDIWNNRLGPVVGAKIKLMIPTAPGHWNIISFGVRGESLHYLTTNRDTLQGIAFIQWGFGGDWKKGK